MEFRVLGPLEVVDAGEALTLRSAQQRAVLALLIIHAPEPLSPDRLIDELWGERPPATAEHAIRVHISGIRKHLRGASAHEAEVGLRTSPSGYVLEVDAEKIDARRFERLLHEGQSVLADDPLSARRLLEEALTLWRGEPLISDLGHSSIAQREAERLVELRIVAAEGLIDARLACGEHPELIGAINRLVAESPLRERPRRQLMLALYRSGRHVEALAAYRDACGALDELGLQPGPELRDLERAILGHDPSLSPPTASTDTGVLETHAVDHVAAAASAPDTAAVAVQSAAALPPTPPADLRPLVGREAELNRLCGLLRDGARLVTLVGTGGVGKTRLALAAGRRVAGELEGGAFVVSLAAVRDPAGLLPAVAHALGVRDVGGDPLRPVVDRLGDRQTLLILDNFEQILAAAPRAGELVAQAPALRVIVTSQAPLRIRAETVFAVEALDPDAAVELFAERAAATARGVAVEDADRPLVAEICERLGRLPLGVELAAARMGVLAPDDILRRLEASSAVLRSGARDAPERHRSLRATLEWTHAALTEPQQMLFRRMGVFAGPVPLVAVEAVAEQLESDDEPLDTLDALEALVDFSLVQRDESAVRGFRFAMPQALREFAREKLLAAGEQTGINRRHAEHLVGVADSSRVWFSASAAEQALVLALDAEVGPALDWAATWDRELHRCLIAALGLMLIRRGRTREANEHLARALEGRSLPEEPLDAWLGNAYASGLVLAGRPAEALASLEPVIEFDRKHGDERELMLALDTLAWLNMELAETDAAVAAADESLELARRTWDRRLLPRALTTLAQTLIDAGRFDEAETLLDEASSHVEELRPDTAIGVATMRADIALGRQDHAPALDLYATSLALAERLGEPLQMVNDAVSIVSLLSIEGKTEAALEADVLLAAIARDVGYNGANVTRGKYREALVALRDSDRTAAERRAAAVPAANRISRILALARGA